MAVQSDSATGKKLTDAAKRKRWRNFQSRTLPPLAGRREADPRRKARRDHEQPFFIELTHKTDATISQASSRAHRHIISAPEKIDMLVTKPKQSLGQKHFDPAIGPIFQKLRWFCFRQRVE